MLLRQLVALLGRPSDIALVRGVLLAVLLSAVLVHVLLHLPADAGVTLGSSRSSCSKSGRRRPRARRAASFAAGEQDGLAEPALSVGREALRRLEKHRLELDRDGPGGQSVEGERHLDHEIECDVPRQRLADGALQLLGRQVDAMDPPPLERAGSAAALDCSDQHECLRLQVVKALDDRDSSVMQVLDDDAGAQLLARERLGGVAAEVQVALVELPDAADEDGQGHVRRLTRRRRS
ncbi:MAG: hypothetical protein ACLGHD_07225, partial [Actinomycetes bacterium]